MGRSQVEYNRKHGRGRGRGRGRGGGRGGSNPENKAAASTSSVPRHLQPTASSKAKTSNDAAVPSHLTRTSSWHDKKKQTSPSRTAQATPSPKTSPGRMPQASSPSTDYKKVTFTARHPTPPTSPTQRKASSNSASKRLQSQPASTAAEAQRTAATNRDGIVAVKKSQTQPASPRKATNSRLKPVEPPGTTSESAFSKKKDPPEESQPLPDSPEQRQSPSKAADTVLLYQSHSHVVMPKPHETPILSIHLQPAPWAEALERTVPWYQRLQLSAYVALSLDPERTDEHVNSRAINESPLSSQNPQNGRANNELDGAVDDLLQNNAMPLVELESINETSTMEKDEANQRKQITQHETNDTPHERVDIKTNSSAGSNASMRNNSGGESRLLQRARRYKEQFSTKSRSHGTSQEGLPAASRKLPDPPAHNRTSFMISRPLQTSSHQADWDIAATMSDLTLPTALHSSEPASRPKPATTGMNVITTVLANEDDDMDEWLESALKTQDEEEEDNPNPTPKASNTQPEVFFQGPMNGKKKEISKEPDFDLDAFAEDEDENMEDWLDDQIS